MSAECRVPGAGCRGTRGRRVLSGERGSGALEFALILPAFLLFLFTIIDGGRMFHTWVVLTHETREAARFGAAYAQEYSAMQGCGGDPTCLQSNLENLVHDQAVTWIGQLIDPSLLDVQVTVTMDGTSPGSMPTDVQVATTYSVAMVTPLVQQLIPSVPLTTYAQMRAE